MLSTKKECVAMLLAGGQGTRLGVLTQDVAKPAVPFGGKYRIIDFPISNTINSGIDTIGVLTQYQPFELNQYIGNGQPWDLDRLNGGAFVLPPYQKGKSGEWYKGTANAIYQNINFIDRYNPEYVLILSGDHIYKMDYSEMLDAHVKNNADCTIAVLNVSIEEASRFGIMNTNENNEIYEFEEKPKHPKSTKASMGIYIFTWSKLRDYLIRDEENKDSSNDFGKNIIPMMLKDGQKLFAYEFSGYWKDVGTISSLWEANMDVLYPEKSGLTLNDRKWKIYARNTAEPPHYIGENAVISNSIVSEGCNIDGKVTNSVIYHGSTVERGAEIKDSIIMPGTKVGANSRICHAIVGWNATIGENCVIGAPQKAPVGGEWKIAVVAPELELERNSVVKEGEMKGGNK
ncbi:MAG: glucose-1-phosphate adenylyltransferase [Clostridiales bacterium]|nr:glucose-1-phosphate adenylyltransferase [Clostridiales bacterium]MDY4655438.1 glucose-1-phosphate adenylyltransferase [Eubacteriales bacterium]